MRVLITGSAERVDRVEVKAKAAGWEVVRAHSLETLHEMAAAGEIGEIDAAVILPVDMREFRSGSCSGRLLEFLDNGLYSRLRALVTISNAVRPRGHCRFVLVGGNIPPAHIPDDQAARARLMGCAGAASVEDGGEGCSAKVLGPSATDDDIVAALTPTGKTPMIVWDLPDDDQALSFDEWRLAVLSRYGSGRASRRASE